MGQHSLRGLRISQLIRLELISWLEFMYFIFWKKRRTFCNMTFVYQLISSVHLLATDMRWLKSFSCILGIHKFSCPPSSLDKSLVALFSIAVIVSRSLQSELLLSLTHLTEHNFSESHCMVAASAWDSCIRRWHRRSMYLIF
jgi:hypothetical protein